VIRKPTFHNVSMANPSTRPRQRGASANIPPKRNRCEPIYGEERTLMGLITRRFLHHRGHCPRRCAPRSEPGTDHRLFNREACAARMACGCNPHRAFGSATGEASCGGAVVSSRLASIVKFASMLTTDSWNGASRRVPAIGASAISISRPSERYLTSGIDARWPAIGS
jgi:hypothetical protein